VPLVENSLLAEPVRMPLNVRITGQDCLVVKLVGDQSGKSFSGFEHIQQLAVNNR
jgi:hypothetical protein